MLIHKNKSFFSGTPSLNDRVREAPQGGSQGAPQGGSLYLKPRAFMSAIYFWYALRSEVKPWYFGPSPKVASIASTFFMNWRLLTKRPARVRRGSIAETGCTFRTRCEGRGLVVGAAAAQSVCLAATATRTTYFLCISICFS